MAKSTAKIRAAGGVIWRAENGATDPDLVEIAVIHRPRYDDWSIPKGKLAPGESELEGALREVFEETGHRAWPGRGLGQVHYLKVADGITREKVVSYWAMRAAGGVFTPGREVDDLRWLRPGDARGLLTRASDRDVLNRFTAAPVLTRSVLLVRHASAGDPSRWRGEDRLRPLDDKGHWQAEELVRLLSRFDVREIVSADNLRCVRTVQPLSESIGVEVTEQPLLSEHGYAGHAEETIELTRTIGEPGSAVVVSSQREVILELLRRLTNEDGLAFDSEPKVKKACTWSLCFDGSRLTDLELFNPPRP